MKILVIAVSLLLFFESTAQTRFQPMFNGRDFSGWYSFLQKKGKNNDPEQVFRFEDGLLHISGKEFGYLATDKSYRDFHMSFQFKWGQKKWPPRHADTTKRDNGILFFVPVDEPDRIWVKSVECQVQEGDVGDFWLIDSATIIVDGSRSVPKDYQRVQKKKDAEKPSGEWNLVEIISLHGKITYKVNGVIVNEGTAPYPDQGRIIIQSEGAEIFYRDVLIAELH